MVKLYAQTLWGDMRDQNQDQLSYVGHVSLHCHRPSKGVWLSLQMKQKHWSVLREKKSCNLVPIETVCSNMWAPTSWYTADCDTARLIFALKSVRLLPEGCCYLNDCIQNQLVMCTSSFLCTLDFQQPQQWCLARSKPSCCICSLPPNNVLWSVFGRPLCMTFW